MAFAAVATASMTVGKQSRALVNETLREHAVRRLDRAIDQTATGPANSEFAVTDQTEILLNGQPCKYAQVPSHASVVHMEVAADKKTVLRIHFQTRK
jgi:hypothetical protein